MRITDLAIKMEKKMSSSQPRLINQRYALDANPQSGGMADVYKAIDMQSSLRQSVSFWDLN